MQWKLFVEMTIFTRDPYDFDLCMKNLFKSWNLKWFNNTTSIFEPQCFTHTVQCCASIVSSAMYILVLFSISLLPLTVSMLQVKGAAKVPTIVHHSRNELILLEVNEGLSMINAKRYRANLYDRFGFFGQILIILISQFQSKYQCYETHVHDFKLYTTTLLWALIKDYHIDVGAH